MKDAKEFSAVKNSIQPRLSGVMLLVLVFALGINELQEFARRSE